MKTQTAQGVHIRTKEVQQVFENVLFKKLLASTTSCKILGFLPKNGVLTTALICCDQILEEQRLDRGIYSLNIVKRHELQLKIYDQFLKIQHFCGNLHFRYRD